MDKLYPVLMILIRIKVKYRMEVVNSYHPIVNKPIIFALNHSEFSDIPIALKACRQRSFILAGKQNLWTIDRLFFILTGVIWVDRKNKTEMAASKERVVTYLKQGQSILWFPEGTWNLTENQLMLPMKWGIIEAARQANAQIIPMALDYDKSKNLCRVKFGIPMAGKDLDNKARGIRDLRDAIATLRWDLICDRPILARAEIDPKTLREETKEVITEYPPFDWEYECSCIYSPTNCISPGEAFEHLQALIPCKENAFLFRTRE